MKTGFVNIQEWMYELGCEDLREIVAYAIIFGFSQDGESKFEGSLQYIMRLLRCSKPTAISTLRTLVDKGLITKEQLSIQNVTFNKYAVNLQVVKNLYHPSKISLPNNIVPSKEGTLESNNNSSLFIEDKNISTTPYNPPSKEKRFSKPSVDDVRAYCNERHNNIDAQHFIDYYESNGWKVGRTTMKDWKAAVRTWERKEMKQPNKFYYGNINTDNGLGRKEPRKRDYSRTSF